MPIGMVLYPLYHHALRGFSGHLNGYRNSLPLVQEQALHTLEQSRTLILDITGVPIVDTQVAQGLISVTEAGQVARRRGCTSRAAHAAVQMDSIFLTTTVGARDHRSPI
jgi:anti-anti-sigma regulatory factor